MLGTLTMFLALHRCDAINRTQHLSQNTTSQFFFSWACRCVRDMGGRGKEMSVCARVSTIPKSCYCPPSNSSKPPIHTRSPPLSYNHARGIKPHNQATISLKVPRTAYISCQSTARRPYTPRTYEPVTQPAVNNDLLRMYRFHIDHSYN